MINQLDGTGVSVTSLRRITSTEVVFTLNAKCHANWYDHTVV